MTRSTPGLALAIARYQLRPLRNLLDPHRAGTGHPTWGVRLGPVPVAGRSVVLRSPRFDDADPWRELRLRDRSRIERWWATSELSWEDRHTTASWISNCLQAGRAARAGRRLPLVLEVDGVLAGEGGLEWISPHTASAELGGWIGSSVRAGRVSLAVYALIIDHAILELGLQRVSAPVCVGNRAAALAMRRIGLRHEGVMAGYLDVAGRRADHDLYAITAEQMPPGGLLAAVLADVPASRPAGVAPPDSEAVADARTSRVRSGPPPRLGT